MANLFQSYLATRRAHIKAMVGHGSVASGWESAWFQCHWSEFSTITNIKQRGMVPRLVGSRLYRQSMKQRGMLRSLKRCTRQMYHQELLPSVDGSGFRYLSGVPEWFGDKVKLSVHKIATADKVNDYVCFTPLCEDGVLWAAKWEVRVDKKRQIVNLSKNNLDRWVQQRGSVHLIALWLCGGRYENMENERAFSEAWNPRFEANPMNRI